MEIILTLGLFALFASYYIILMRRLAALPAGSAEVASIRRVFKLHVYGYRLGATHAGSREIRVSSRWCHPRPEAGCARCSFPDSWHHTLLHERQVPSGLYNFSPLYRNS